MLTGFGEPFGDPLFRFFHVVSGSTDSHFEVAFDVDVPTPIRLRGSVSAAQDTPCCIGSTAGLASFVRLRTAGGQVLAEVVAEVEFGCTDGCDVVGPLPLVHEAVLPPGSYVLEASSAGSGGPFFFAQTFGTVVASGAYSVELSVLEVPALGGGGRALLALLLGLAAVPFLARPRRRR